MDTEATGLTEECVLIQLAFVPVDTDTKTVAKDLGREWLVQCDSFEKLKPSLNSWVIENNEGLIRKAHAEGLTARELLNEVTEYLTSPALKAFFPEKPVLLGKSLSALDIPLLTRTFGQAFMQQHFHYHTLDVTCVARAMVDAGRLPPGTQSSSKIMKHFGIREAPAHTALFDALDMGEIYLRLLEDLKVRAKT